MARESMELLQGTLDVLILHTLRRGPMHGYAVTRWIRERTEGTIEIEDAPLYKALHRLEGADCVAAEWGLVREQPPRALLPAHLARAAAAQGRRVGLADLRRGRLPGAGARVMRRVFQFPRRSPRQIDADVDEELRFHIETRTDELVARDGLSREAARAEALREFGDVEETRRYISRLDRMTETAQRRRDYMDELRQDVAYAVRTLRASPAFTLTAVLTLALGIGANTAIFSVVDRVLLRPLPFPHPEELVKVWSANRSADNMKAAVSPVDLDDWRAERTPARGHRRLVVRRRRQRPRPDGTGDPQRLSATFVTPGFFGTFGVNAAEGRLPRDDEMVRGGNDRVVVLSHGFWQRQFGGAPAVDRQRDHPERRAVRRPGRHAPDIHLSVGAGGRVRPVFHHPRQRHPPHPARSADGCRRADAPRPHPRAGAAPR